MVRAIGDQVEQVSVMNKLLNDALRAKGYKGPDIKMVLTDVNDPNGPYYTDTLTNVVVFDRKELAKSDRDKILNALGHEFGHYSKEDDIDKTQDIANHTGRLLEDRTKGMVGKEATEETLAGIRNNKNVITGEEGRLLAESIPMDRREYVKWRRVGKGFAVGVFGFFRTVVAAAEIKLGGPIGWGHGGAQGFFGLSETIEGLDHIRLGIMDIDEDEKPAFSLSRTILGDSEEFINLGVGMTTEHAFVYGQAFTKIPNIFRTTGNKSSAGSNQKLEQSKNGMEVAVEDSTAIKTVSNNKNSVNQNNSKEVVLYEDKNSKITVDVAGISEDTGVIENVNSGQQAQKANVNNSKNNVASVYKENNTDNQQASKGATSNQQSAPVSKTSVINDKSGGSQGVTAATQKVVSTVSNNNKVGDLTFYAKENGYEVYYRTMSPEDYESFKKTGKIPATGETFISPTQAYSEKYDGVLVKFKVESGTTEKLMYIGFRDNSETLTKEFSNMKKAPKGWAENNVYFKQEPLTKDKTISQVNIGLGKGEGLDTFNENIVESEVINMNNKKEVNKK